MGRKKEKAAAAKAAAAAEEEVYTVEEADAVKATALHSVRVAHVLFQRAAESLAESVGGYCGELGYEGLGTPEDIDARLSTATRRLKRLKAVVEFADDVFTDDVFGV